MYLIKALSSKEGVAKPRACGSRSVSYGSRVAGSSPDEPVFFFREVSFILHQDDCSRHSVSTPFIQPEVLTVFLTLYFSIGCASTALGVLSKGHSLEVPGRCGICTPG